MAFQVRGVWSGPSEAGFTRESVGDFLDGLLAIGINSVFMNLKQGDGSLSWPSKRFPQAVRPEYRDFDLPAILIEEGKRRQMFIHAWMIDFMEGEEGAAFREHPEWAMLNPAGKPTNHEILRGKRFDAVWMCPARRPGYSDQWLVPLYEELAQMYSFDSIHHDYIRYPGDMAPDQYCYCDYCLENLPKWAGYINEAYPDEPFHHELYDRGYLEAHWEQSPRVLPPSWDGLSREFKANFLREGSFFQGGRADLDFFFYGYRMHWITEFARMSGQRVYEQGGKISGAYFKNPIHSGRFIGQDWRTFAPWSDVCIPMDYRDHFPGTMDHYLDLLQEAIERQREWCGHGEAQRLFVGFAIWPLYREAPDGPFDPDRVRRTIERIESTGVEGVVIFCSWDLDKYGVRETVARAFGR